MNRRNRVFLLVVLPWWFFASTLLMSCSGEGDPAGSAVSSDIDCVTEINGTRVGYPGNIQDNMFQSIGILPTNPDVVLVGTESSGIFKSTDGGTTWGRLRQGLCSTTSSGYGVYPQVFQVLFDPADPLRMYVAMIGAPGNPLDFVMSAIGGPYRSSDGGATFEQIINGITNTYMNNLALEPGNPAVLYGAVGGLQDDRLGTFLNGALFKTENRGDTWSALTPPPGAETNIPQSMFFTAAPAALYIAYSSHGGDASTEYGLAKSTDGGASFTFKNPVGQVLAWADYAASDNNILYGCDRSTQRKMHRSPDGGDTWVQMGGGCAGAPVRVHPTNPEVIVYGNFKTIFRSADGGATATISYDTDADAALPANTSGVNRQLTDLRFAPSDPNILYATAKGYLVFKSTDGGVSFHFVADLHDHIDGGGDPQ